jgi:RND family efflux transporter MFP subunit
VEEAMSLDERRNVQTPVKLEDEQGDRQRPSSPPGNVKRIISAVVVLLLVGGIIFWGIAVRTKASVTVARETREMAVSTVAVVRPQRASPSQEIVLPADIQAWTDAPIYARTNGYLKRWYVDIGAHVKAGQLLAEIETPEVDQQLQQARADLATAEANYRLAEITAARFQDLLKSDSVSKQDTDNAVGDFQAKKAMVQSAQFNVKRLQDLQSFQKIYAPFEGVITVRKTDIGALINSGNGGPALELFHIAATRTMRVYVNVPQIYSRAARPGLTADLVLPEFSGRRFQGKLVRTAEAIDAATGTLLTEIDVNNPTGELLPGAYAEVHLKVPAGSSTYLLPVNTLIFRSAGLRVATVIDGNHAVLVPVTLGRDFGTEVEVVAGLNGEETVIVNPPDSLVSNATVRIAQPVSTGGEGK